VSDQMYTDLNISALQLPHFLFCIELKGLGQPRRVKVINGIPCSEPLAADQLAVHCPEDQVSLLNLSYKFSSLDNILMLSGAWMRSISLIRYLLMMLDKMLHNI
jgi:hypothetical protein